MINYGIVTNVVSVVLVVLGAMMLCVLPFSFYYGTHDEGSMLITAAVTMGFGAAFWYFSKKTDRRIRKREGYLIVALSWLLVSFFSAFPYWISGVLPEVTNAFFESVSGLTTTGASVINNIEASPKDILFWRSLTQWLGGMGIIVLTVAIFPLLGIGGVELFVAEAPGPTSDKIHPRIKETAKRLWMIYVGFTALLTLILWLEGLPFFDAINHGLTTMATGGFSTQNASVADYSPAVQYTITFFMFLAGINYTILYFSLKGNFKQVWKSDEFKTYLGLLLVLIVTVTLVVAQVTEQPFEKSFRDSIFQILSMVTTTGFVSTDYTAWVPGLTLLFFLLLFVGACAGSTSGGIKVIRHLVIFKTTAQEFKRLLHPKAIVPVKIDGEAVNHSVLTHILVFLMLYLLLFIIGSGCMVFILSGWEAPFLTATGATATALGNVGPALGGLGPLDNFAEVPMAGKWVLIFLMLLGRLELFTILIILTPYFWRLN